MLVNGRSDMGSSAIKYPNNLRAARDLRNMTQQQVADAAGVTLNAYQNYEYGKRDIKASMLARLAKALDVTCDYLIGIDSEPRYLPSVSPDRRMLPVATRETKLDSNGQPIGCTLQQEVTNTLYQMHGHAWWLITTSHSMDRIIPAGAVALVDPEAQVRNGDIALVAIESREPTLRRIFFEGPAIRLCCESNDSDYRDEVVATDNVHIFGRMVSFSARDSWRA